MNIPFTLKNLCNEFYTTETNEQEKEWFNVAIAEALKVKDGNKKRPNSIDIALALQSIRVDNTTLIAALISSPLLEQNWSEDQLKTTFNNKIAALVISVRWLNNFKGCTDETNLEAVNPQQAESVRRMILSIVEDVRAVLIKLAYRLKRLNYLALDTYEVRKCIAQETLDIYTPLANRLGIAHFKWQMEDLAFRNLNPQAYKYIAKSLEEKRTDRENYLNDFVKNVDEYLKQEKITAKIAGRPKHIYSIWKKMQNKKLDITSLYDVRAVRVLVNTLPECYLVLGLVHQHWQPITQEFDDYISHPKPNGYSSLHTAIIGPQGKAVEIQIRTHDMHEHAELGYAAHWKYKEGGKQDANLEQSINALRHLLDKNDNDEHLLENFNQDLFENRVFVFTPEGEVQELPKGSTPLDFAYKVHTNLGHKCRGALINGKIVALTTELKNGDQVEILTRKLPQPSRDWMSKVAGYVYSSRVRTKIRNWFNALDKDKHSEDGKQIFEKELSKNHINLSESAFFIDKFRCDNIETLYLDIGKGKINHHQIGEAWNRENQETVFTPKQSTKKTGSSQVSVSGVDNLLIHFPQCCNPVPYDDILGFITQGKGVSIHRKNCINIQNLNEDEQKRLIAVDWQDDSLENYTVNIIIVAWDRTGLLKDITVMLGDLDVDVSGIHSKSDKENHKAIINVSLEVKHLQQLTKVMNKLQGLPNVVAVNRV